MSASKVLHFEVQAQVGRNWTILCIAGEQAEAVHLAKHHRAKGGYGAVRVMREKYDRQSGMFRSAQVHMEGREKKPSKFDDQSLPVSCWRPGDFYSVHGRQTIGRLLRDELDRWGITATELVHSPDYVERLEDTGTVLQRAVQQIAIAEAQQDGGDVQGRIKQLYELVEMALEELRRDWQSGDVPTLNPNRLLPLLGALDGRQNPGYWLTCGMIGYLADAPDRSDKISRVLALLSDGAPDWAVNVFDGLVGELLEAGDTVRLLVGEQEDLGHALLALAELGQGRFERADPNGVTAVLNRFMADRRLMATEAGIVRILKTALVSRRWLGDGDVLTELELLSALRARLCQDDGALMGGDEMAEALDRRTAIYLNAECLGGYLDSAEHPYAQIANLLELEPHVVGNANKRTLANFLLPLLDDPRHIRHLTEQNGSVVERMQAITALQRRVLASGFQDMHRRKIAEAFDGLCVQVIRANDVLKRALGDGDSVAKALRLLQLCAGGCFTDGQALGTAQAWAKKFIGEKDFLQRYLDAEGPEPQENRLVAFRRLLEQAGFTDDQAA